MRNVDRRQGHSSFSLSLSVFQILCFLDRSTQIDLSKLSDEESFSHRSLTCHWVARCFVFVFFSESRLTDQKERFEIRSLFLPSEHWSSTTWGGNVEMSNKRSIVASRMRHLIFPSLFCSLFLPLLVRSLSLSVAYAAQLFFVRAHTREGSFFVLPSSLHLLLRFHFIHSLLRTISASSTLSAPRKTNQPHLSFFGAPVLCFFLCVLMARCLDVEQ